MKTHYTLIASLVFLFACGGGDPGGERSGTAESSEADASMAALVDDVAAAIDSCVRGTAAPEYTQREHQIYQELMDAPMSQSEADAAADIARRYELEAAEVLEISERGQRAVFFGAQASGTEGQVTCVVSRFAGVHSVTVSGDFANVGYIEQFEALNDEAVRSQAVARMPYMLEAIFAIPAVQRVRLTAHYPAIDATGSSSGVKRIGGLEARRADFLEGKPAASYPQFWLSDG